MSTIAEPIEDRRAEGPGRAVSALAGLSLAALLSALGTSIANVGLPAMAAGFGASFPAVQWVVLAYLLAMTAAVVGAGRLGDLFGRRRLLVAGIMLFSAASAAAGLAPTLPVVIAMRALQGLGAAVMTALAVAMVGEAVPAGRAGRAMGLLGAMSAAGTALGPSLGGALVSGFGWRAVFLATVPLGLVAAGLVRRGLPAVERTTIAGRGGFDTAGTASLALALIAYALAMTTGRAGIGPQSLGFLVIAGGGLVAFLHVEARVATPLIRPAMLREPRLAAGCAANALVATVMMATLIVGPFHLSGALALGIGATGLAMSVGPVVAALAGIPAGALADRIGPRRGGLAGLAGIAGGCALLAGIPETAGVLGYVLPLAAVTAGYALFQAANTTAVMAAAGPDRRGVVSGLLQLSRNMGLISGASLVGALFSAAIGPGDVAIAGPAAIASATRTTFAVMGGLAVIAAGVLVRLPASAREGE